jgi:hypothetical protein
MKNMFSVASVYSSSKQWLSRVFGLIASLVASVFTILCSFMSSAAATAIDSSPKRLVQCSPTKPQSVRAANGRAYYHRRDKFSSSPSDLDIALMYTMEMLGLPGKLSALA